MQLCFGDFTLDVDRGQLRHLDVDRHLSPIGFELLRLLVENRPRPLSKHELHKHLWSGVYFSEAALSSLIAEVRRALKETALREGFVRTVPRFGYAFQGDANEVHPAALDRDPPVRCWLVWESGQASLRDGEHLLGRDGNVAVRLDSPTVSRHHAKIRVSGSGATIEDLRSRNGTFLGGERLTARAPLADGDEITLGSFAIRFLRVEAGLPLSRVRNEQLAADEKKV